MKILIPNGLALLYGGSGSLGAGRFDRQKRDQQII